MNESNASGVGNPGIVIFDLGEVLVTPGGLIEDLAARVECDAGAFKTAYWRRRLEYDLGLDAVEYWIDLLEALGVVVSTSVIEDLIRIDTAAWTTVRPDAAELLEKLHKSGTRIGILSNATIEMSKAARTSVWSRWVSDWFLSAELGLAKPDPAIYAYVTEAVRLPPKQIDYIEDSPRSVAVAQAAGWSAHTWTSGPDTAAYLAALVG